MKNLPDLALPLEFKIIDKAAITTMIMKMVLMTILPFALALSISELLKNRKISHKVECHYWHSFKNA